MDIDKEINEEKIDILKRKRSMLQIEKNKLFNKFMNAEEKSIYRFGLGVVTVVAAILFYSTYPILVVTLPITYIIGVPSIRMFFLLKKEYLITNEIINLDNEIYNIENKEKEKEVSNEYKYEHVYMNINSSNLDIKKEVDGPKLIKKK